MIISRHEVLRYSFVNDKGTPSIKVKESVELLVVDRDVGGEAAEVDATIREFIADPFDLSEAPLLRAAVFRRGERDGTLVFVLHHLVCDGWSLGVLIEEFNSIYNKTVCQEGGEEAVLPYQYSDWSEWQIGLLEDGAFDAGLEYWRGRLADLEELSLDGFQASALADEVKDNGYVQLDLSRDVVTELDRACGTRGLTRFAALLAAFCAVLYRLSGKERFGVGVPVSGRDEFGTHKLIGLFVNTVVLRQDISGELDIWELAERTQAEMAAGLQHGDVPFEEVVRALEPDRHLAATPLCNVMFAYDKIHRSSLRLAGLDTTPMDLRNEDPKMGLAVRFDDDEYGTTIGMEHRCSFVSHKTMETLARQFETTLGLMIQGDAARIGNIGLLGAAESKREISEASGGSLSEPGIDVGIEDYICDDELIADRLAIVSGDKSVTYQKLRQESENIARAVLELEPYAEECVGILSADPLYSVVGMMSTLRAGCAFVIVDQEEPRARVRQLLQLARCRIVLVDQGGAPALEGAGCNTIDMRTVGDGGTHNGRKCKFPVRPESLAYVVFTSGTSGVAKGVMVEHQNIRSYLRCVVERLDLKGDRSYLIPTTLSADLCFTMLFPSLAIGGTLHLVSGDTARDPRLLSEYIRRWRIDYMKTTPSHVYACWSVLREEFLLPRECLVVGGEATDRRWATEAVEHQASRIYNHYGPAETTVGVLTRRFSDELPRDLRTRNVPTGYPLRGTSVYVLDSCLEPVARGISGDIWVGGRGVSRGYLGDAALTAECFMPDPLSAVDGSRMYKTGDRGRRVENGEIEFLGRRDRQAKIRGHRVELAAVERELARFPEIRRAVVSAQDVGKLIELCAWVSLEEGASTSVPEIRQRLREVLPASMVPSHINVVDEFPMTRNGKIDTKQLAVGKEPRRQSGSERMSDVEVALLGLWQEVLGGTSIDLEDGFFDVGGDSLLGAQLIALAQDHFGIELGYRDLYTCSTIVDMATKVEQLRAESDEVLSEMASEQVAKMSDEEVRKMLGDL